MENNLKKIENNTDEILSGTREAENAPNVSYDVEKDFYRGVKGELRFKAEGLFKKAKEKGISIESIEILPLKENIVSFPGIGNVELPAYIAKVKGKELTTGREIVDGKLLDYFNRYQKYMADRIEGKNIQREKKDSDTAFTDKFSPELFLTEWERFEIGKAIIEDKEFGLEKTITGACDRVIRKLMGENDWLYSGEARLLDEEFENVQDRIKKEEENRQKIRTSFKKASDRQINYLKSRIKNAGLNPDDTGVLNKIISETGFEDKTIDELSMAEMSRVIDSVSSVIPKIRETYGEYKQ